MSFAASSTGFSVTESGTQARTGNEYGTGTRGTGSECEARGVMGRRKIEKEKLRFPAPPHHSPRPRPAFRFIFRAGDWGRDSEFRATFLSFKLYTLFLKRALVRCLFKSRITALTL